MTRTQKLWKAVCQIILMERDSPRGAERCRVAPDTYLCQSLWESEGTDRGKPLQARRRVGEQGRKDWSAAGLCFSSAMTFIWCP